MFGTVYNITYQSNEDLSKQIRHEMARVDSSLSMFNPRSVVTSINSNKSMIADEMMIEVFTLAKTVSDETDGAFDITVAPLVNAWGFGFEGSTMPNAQQVDSLLEMTGYKKVWLEGNKIVKSDPRVRVDCSAIAKGYASDMVAKMLEANGVKNYLVEIGGEIVTGGVSPQKAPWKVGVTKPTDDSLSVKQEIETIINITDKAMATSGNYRNFYYKDGKKYAHTIDPKTGYPVQHNILSATVLAPNCATADAYATAFMVMGLEKTKDVLRRHPELMAFLICASDDGGTYTWISEELQGKIGD